MGQKIWKKIWNIFGKKSLVYTMLTIRYLTWCDWKKKSIMVFFIKLILFLFIHFFCIPHFFRHYLKVIKRIVLIQAFCPALTLTVCTAHPWFLYYMVAHFTMGGHWAPMEKIMQFDLLKSFGRKSRQNRDFFVGKAYFFIIRTRTHFWATILFKYHGSIHSSNPTHLKFWQ